MKTTTVLGAAAIAAAFATALWSRAAGDRRIDALERRVEDLRVPALSARADDLADRLEAAEVELASLRGEADALGARLAEEGERIADQVERAAALAQEVSAARAASERVASELRAQMEEQAQSFALEEERLRELELAVGRLDVGVAPAAAAPGTIVAWLPGNDPVPEGWRVCDGTGGTPDLRGLFLRGADLGTAGRYRRAAEMRPAGLHAHATDPNRSRYNLTRATPREPGDWRILFDQGVTGDDPAALADHGRHVHADEHVPEHLTVVYLMKVEQGG